MLKGDRIELKGHHCLTNNLIKIAKVEPKSASIICEEANRLGITYNSIPDIMSRVGLGANALYNAQLVNNKPSREPSTTAIRDKEYPESALGDDYDSCVENLSQLVTKDRAIEECSTQWKSVGSKTGSCYSDNMNTRSAQICAETKAYYTNVLSGKELANIQADNEDDCIKELQDKGIDDPEDACSKAFSSKAKSSALLRQKLMLRIRGKYPMLSPDQLKELIDQAIEEENGKGKPKQASLSREIPYWVGALNIDTNHLESNSNLMSASVTQNHFEITPIADMIRNNVDRRNEQSRLKGAALKEKDMNAKPAWAAVLGL